MNALSPNLIARFYTALPELKARFTGMRLDESVIVTDNLAITKVWRRS